MTPQVNRMTLFDAWAAQYDTAVAAGDDDFPFAGYDEVLATAVHIARVRPSLRVLELGIGTGNLAGRFIAAGCQVWGLDFSAAMLAQARIGLPQAHLVQADLLAAWPLAARPLFDRSPPTSCMNLTCMTKSGFCSGRSAISWRRTAFWWSPTLLSRQRPCATPPPSAGPGGGMRLSSTGRPTRPSPPALRLGCWQPTSRCPSVLGCLRCGWQTAVHPISNKRQH